MNILTLIKKPFFWLMISTMALIGCNRKSPEKKAQHIKKWVTYKLELNTEQEKHLDALMVELIAFYKDNQSSKKLISSEISTFLAREKIDEELLRTFTKRHLDQMENNSFKSLEMYVKFHNSLNEAQRNKIQKFIAKRIEKRQ